MAEKKVEFEKELKRLEEIVNKIQDEKHIDNSSKNKLSDIAKQSNDLKSKVDSLITLTKKLENNNKELNTKTNDLTNKFSQISLTVNNPQRQEQISNIQYQSRKISNPKTKYYCTIENQNYPQEISYYNRTNPNINTNLNLSKDTIEMANLFCVFETLMLVPPILSDAIKSISPSSQSRPRPTLYAVTILSRLFILMLFRSILKVS